MKYSLSAAHADKLLWVAGVFVAIVVTAALVNRFRPIQRPRLRRLVTVFALFAAATATGIGFEAAQLPTWASGCLTAAEVLQAFTLISLAATLMFAIMLPGVGLELPMIASDLIVGLGYVVVALVILARHGVNPTGALVSGAVVSAVLAISLQSTLGNIVGGVALQLDGSVREGDWIQLDNGKQGRVRSVRWRHTVLEARDWSTIIVPNSLLLATTITILGKRDGRSVPQRMVVGFNVDFRFAPTQVIEVVSDALRSSAIDNVASDPPPDVVCTDFAKDGKDSYAAYAVRYWLIDLAGDDGTSTRVRARIYAALQRARIPLAARTSFVELKDDARAARRAERQIDDRFAALKTVHLFRTLTDDELRTLAAGMIHVMYTDGELITRQGAAAHWLYVMTDGSAEIRTHYEPTPNDAAQLIDPTTPLPVAAHAATRPPAEAPNRAAQRAGIDHLGSAGRRGESNRKEIIAAEASSRPARLARGEADQKVRVAQLTAPDFFGEMSLMTGAPRSADVIAIGDVDCFRLGKDTFKTVLLGRPEIATELSAKLASRRVELMAARGAIDPASRSEREASERDRILGGIKAFFALD